MSRAFVKEQDEVKEDLPERAISSHPNFVTPDGLAQIEAQIAELTTAAEGAEPPAIVLRDLRYWTARRSSAESVDWLPGDEVRFGATVTIERADGRRQTFRIVGEDEADPNHGTLSYVSPLARALTGKGQGDEFDFRGDTIAVVGIS